MNWTHKTNVRIAKKESPTCLTCKIRFTIKHMPLIECRQYGIQRGENNKPDCLHKILGLQIEATNKIIQFL